MNLLIGFLIGVIVGSFSMIILLAMCNSSKLADESMDRFDRQEVEDSIDE